VILEPWYAAHFRTCQTDTRDAEIDITENVYELAVAAVLADLL
jgi:hypothetical protein